jgi:hypothetical protein
VSGGPGDEQLGQLVGSADESPRGLDFDEQAQEELTEVACLAYLADDRFDRLFAQAVARSPIGALQLSGEFGHPTPIFRLEPVGNLRAGLAVGRAAKRGINLMRRASSAARLSSRQKPASVEARGAWGRARP